MVPKRYHACARESCNINHRKRGESLRISERITEYEPTFGIGVQNFYGLSRHAGDHITRLCGSATGHVFSSCHNCDYVDLKSELGDRFYRTQNTRSAAHIKFHLIHFCARLQ